MKFISNHLNQEKQFWKLKKVMMKMMKMMNMKVIMKISHFDEDEDNVFED